MVPVPAQRIAIAREQDDRRAGQLASAQLARHRQPGFWTRGGVQPQVVLALELLEENAGGLCFSSVETRAIGDVVVAPQGHETKEG